MPSHVPVVGSPSIHNNEIRDVTANLLTKVYHDVMIEPDLQPLMGEAMTYVTSNPSKGARLDIAVNDFWSGHYVKSFLDVIVFNSHTYPIKQQHQHQQLLQET